jgi:hypothetical protein
MATLRLWKARRRKRIPHRSRLSSIRPATRRPLQPHPNARLKDHHWSPAAWRAAADGRVCGSSSGLFRCLRKGGGSRARPYKQQHVESPATSLSKAGIIIATHIQFPHGKCRSRWACAESKFKSKLDEFSDLSHWHYPQNTSLFGRYRQSNSFVVVQLMLVPVLVLVLVNLPRPPWP